MRIMIATPCYDGKVDVWFSHSVVETVKEGIKRGDEIFPLYISYDALIQRTRNDLFAIGYHGGYDYVFWIDSDIEWTPEQFYEMIDSKYDVVGGTYRKKTDSAEEYVMKMKPETSPLIKKKFIEVDGLGTGFLCMSKKAVKDVWDASISYNDPRDDDRGGEKKLAFNVEVINGDLYSEDIIFCMTLRKLGYKIMLNTEVTCNHIGIGKKYTGDFSKWFFRSFKL